MTKTYIQYVDDLLCLLRLYIDYFGETDIKCKYLFESIYNIFESEPELYHYFDLSPYNDLYT